MIKKVLVANRGEIALRIAKTLQKMSIPVVAVYSEADRNSPHLFHADEAYPLSGTTAAETYLNAEKILEIACSCRAEAIHPGYGFLSENPSFAEACFQAGIIFIGPSSSVLQKVGNKLQAKRIAEEAGVPVIPSFPVQGGLQKGDLKKAAEKLGYPLLLKAVAGGGGKGIRPARDPKELERAFEEAEQEAQSAFGDSRLFLEKYFHRARHIEVQIFGDHYGNIVHLFERECSLQRRHQKIMEETPAAVLSFQQRKLIGEAAVRMAKTIEYTNAGTIEFLMDFSGSFYFLEVNPRLQVEHAITEMTLRRDLVRAQVQVASGDTLPFYQATLKPEGYALECRIYAEDPRRNFLPCTGKIECYVPPSGPEIRVDSGIQVGMTISSYYDPLLAKVVVWGRSRLEAVKTMSWALKNFIILGINTNLEFLQRLVSHPKFLSGEIHTKFIEDYGIELLHREPIPETALIVAAFAAAQTIPKPEEKPEESPPEKVFSDPWAALSAWRAF